MKPRFTVLLIIATCGAIATNGIADIAKAAKKIQQEKQDAVIWVEGVLSMQISSQGQNQSREQKVETLGTVVAESGLTVVPSSALNPSGMLTRMMRGSGMSVDGQLADVKLRLADGTEVEAEVVLKDDDLDIAFVAPSAADDLPAFTSVKMESEASPAILDQIVMLGRMPKFMNRQPSVALSRVISVVDKPRTFYCLDNISSMGIPAFSKKGELIGISVLRKAAKLDFSSGQNSGVIPVILPIEDIRDIAKQALAEIARRAEEE